MTEVLFYHLQRQPIEKVLPTLLEKSLVGSIFGSANPRRDIPRLLRLYQEGKLKLDELIARRIRLEEVNDAFAEMKTGKVARSVIVFD